MFLCANCKDNHNSAACNNCDRIVCGMSGTSCVKCKETICKSMTICTRNEKLACDNCTLPTRKLVGIFDILPLDILKLIGGQLQRRIEKEGLVKMKDGRKIDANKKCTVCKESGDDVHKYILTCAKTGCSNTSNWLRVCRYCLENHLDKTKTKFKIYHVSPVTSIPLCRVHAKPFVLRR